MNSHPGRLRGGGVRQLPEELRRELLEDSKTRTGKGRRLVSARYRVVGYRNGAGAWVQRNPRTGKYWVRSPTGKQRVVRSEWDTIRRSPVVSVEIELDRGRGPRIYYTTLRGPLDA